MGCEATSLDLLPLSHIQDVDGRRENYISFGKFGTSSGEYKDNGTDHRIPPSNCKPNVCIFTKEGEDNEVHVRYLNPLQTSTKIEDDSRQQISKRGESGNDEDTTMD